MVFECCVGSYNEAVNAEKNKADRVELCDNLIEGGTTPSYGTIKKTIENLKIPVMVIIRPRGGNFIFNNNEAEIMKEDIRICKKLGAYGVVIGAIKDKKVDSKLIKELINEAKPMKITFHMAFDEIEDKFKAIDELYTMGVDRILTTGGASNALEGKENLKKFIEYADNRIIIMPGKGITKENRDIIINYTKAQEVHGSKIV